eukprot:TRINITY_DN13256_c4_g1_i1.p1 TRINITY_DN13256_c4_g1~~TRINITY_DN13256_c4_g1_i1.p1  ORF type:complete len:109 (+),score=8.34 TRINITY_DN13256_c4_g1_i1:324-650(+)
MFLEMENPYKFNRLNPSSSPSPKQAINKAPITFKPILWSPLQPLSLSLSLSLYARARAIGHSQESLALLTSPESSPLPYSLSAPAATGRNLFLKQWARKPSAWPSSKH